MFLKSSTIFLLHLELKPKNGFKLKIGFDFRRSVSVWLTFWLQLFYTHNYTSNVIVSIQAVLQPLKVFIYSLHCYFYPIFLQLKRRRKNQTNFFTICHDGIPKEHYIMWRIKTAYEGTCTYTRKKILCQFERLEFHPDNPRAWSWVYPVGFTCTLHLWAKGIIVIH